MAAKFSEPLRTVDGSRLLWNPPAMLLYNDRAAGNCDRVKTKLLDVAIFQPVNPVSLGRGVAEEGWEKGLGNE